MNAHLVLVHGRSQEHEDAAALKGAWLTALGEGLEAAGLTLPVSPEAVHFPYYGQTLFDLVGDVPRERVAEVIVKGGPGEGGADADELAMAREIVLEVKAKTGVTDDQIAEIAGQDVIERGLLNDRWILAVLRAVDRHVPLGSGGAIALFTKDVHHYLNNPGIRDQIEAGVRKAMRSDLPCVVVGHSLGSVVAYNLLRREGEANGWNVPLFVTLGSPLAIKAIRLRLAPNEHPRCVGRWFNAMDDRDVVALHPLAAPGFDIDPAVENKTDVKNSTDNRHGISGYLNDPDVARRIHGALTG